MITGGQIRYYYIGPVGHSTVAANLNLLTHINPKSSRCNPIQAAMSKTVATCTCCLTIASIAVLQAVLLNNNNFNFSTASVRPCENSS